MTTLKEIKNAVATALKKAYPNHNVYGVDTVESYKKPSFFVYVTQTFSESTKNATHKNVEIEIDYIQKTADELDAMDFFESMERLFCHKMKLKNRQLTTGNHMQYFEGEHSNIPVYSFEVEFWSAIDKENDNSALMGELRINEEVKE